MTEEEHFRGTMDTGRGLSDASLVRALCREAREAVTEVQRFGIQPDMRIERLPGALRAPGTAW